MADPRLNSLHLEPTRRQEYRRARDTLLRARGSHTICACRPDESVLSGLTAIRKGDGAAAEEAVCWLVDGEFIYPLQLGVNTVGRSSDNNVVLDDAYASRRHCALLVHSNETCELHDTASKNGTYVNGKRLAGPAFLKSGDEIQISNQRFVFCTRSGIAGPPSHATLSG
jgi:hypothetical protein